MPELAGPRECPLGDQILQVACRGRARGLGDADIVLGTQAAFESVEALAEHAGDDLLLARIELVAQPFMEFRLGDKELDAPEGGALRFEDGVGKIAEPPRDLVVLLLRSSAA
jgi:hypothetical protein